MAKEKEVKVKIKADVEDSKVKSLEQELEQLKNKKLDMQINVNKSKLDEVEAEIKKLENYKNMELPMGVKLDKKEIQETEQRLKQLEQDKIDLEVKVQKDALDKAKAEAESMDGKTIDMSLQLAYQNFAQGIQTCKQGVEDLLSSMKEVEQAGIQTEQNMAFLTKNLGADKAKQTFQDISDIVASMPGDDNTMRSVLSTAQAMGNNLNADEMRQATATMADYMAGSAMMGKMEKETQQDILKYLLDGNTAELERGSIVSSRVDKLKQANTFMERQKAMQEVLNELGYGGISQMDTLYNKQQEWNGMIYNSQAALSGLWRNAEMGLIDFALGLNEATGGLAGMAIVMAQMAGGPIVDIVTGLGQIGMGFKSLKEAASFLNIGEKLSSLKTSLIDVATNAKNAAVSLASTLKSAIVSAAQGAKTLAVELAKVSKELLINAANALKSAAAWVIDKAARLASAVASGIMTVAQWALNLAMSANPVMLVVIAIVALIAILWYLYNTCEPVKNAIDTLGQVILGVFTGTGEFGNSWLATMIQILMGPIGWILYLIQHWEMVRDTIMQVFTGTGEAGNGWVALIIQVLMGPIGWILMLIQHWNEIVPAVTNALSGMYSAAVNWFNQTGQRIHNFASDLVGTLGSAARNAVSSFASGISGIASAIAGELDRAWSAVVSWGQQLIQRFWQIAVDAVNALKKGLGIGSPGFMYYMVEGEINRIDDLAKNTDMPSSFGTLGKDMVNNFNPDLNAGVGTGGAGGVVNNFNFTFTDFIDDKNKLTELIVKTITDEINWNNDTANRTV